MQVGSWIRKIPLAEKMKICPSILAQKSPWTVEPGRPISMGSQKLDMPEATEHTRLYHEPAPVFITLSHLFIPVESEKAWVVAEY